MNTLIFYLSRLVVLIFILPAHEFAHAYAAHLNGDDTAKYSGRMTLNPLKHFDPVGLVCFLLVGFGWAKPVPVNPWNYKHYKKGCFWISVAGVLTNLLLAFLSFPLYLICLNFAGGLGLFGKFLTMVFYWGFALDLSFCVFNLIPVYPLDGFRLVDAFSKKRGKVYNFLRVYGHYILLGLILLSTVADMIPQLAFLDIFGYLMNFVVNIVGYPITAFWDMIFRLIFG